MTRRIVLLGSTGLNKMTLAGDLRTMGDRLGTGTEIVEIEQQISKQMNYKNWSQYLDTDVYSQANVWNDGWESTKKVFEDDSKDHEIVVGHGSLIDETFGARPGLNPFKIAKEFNPNLVVTLIDNVFQMWFETEARAEKNKHQARPTLEQLLMARRVEILIGDQIVAAAGDQGRIPHYLLSVNNPRKTFENLLLHQANLVYLSFPISIPRRLLRSEKKQSLGEEFVAGINSFHQHAASLQRDNPKIGIVSPLTIDELPFSRFAMREIAELIKSERELEEFNLDFSPLKYCWNIDDLFPADEKFSRSREQSKKINAKLAFDVLGSIGTDVTWRDSRLTTQSQALAVYCPVGPDFKSKSRMARGVETEILLAAKNHIPCHIYQDIRFDPEDVLGNWIGKKEGTMGKNIVSRFVHVHSSQDDLFQSLTKSIVQTR